MTTSKLLTSLTILIPRRLIQVQNYAYYTDGMILSNLCVIRVHLWRSVRVVMPITPGLIFFTLRYCVISLIGV